MKNKNNIIPDFKKNITVTTTEAEAFHDKLNEKNSFSLNDVGAAVRRKNINDAVGTVVKSGAGYLVGTTLAATIMPAGAFIALAAGWYGIYKMGIHGMAHLQNKKDSKSIARDAEVTSYMPGSKPDRFSAARQEYDLQPTTSKKRQHQQDGFHFPMDPVSAMRMEAREDSEKLNKHYSKLRQEFDDFKHANPHAQDELIRRYSILEPMYNYLVGDLKKAIDGDDKLLQQHIDFKRGQGKAEAEDIELESAKENVAPGPDLKNVEIGHTQPVSMVHAVHGQGLKTILNDLQKNKEKFIKTITTETKIVSAFTTAGVGVAVGIPQLWNYIQVPTQPGPSVGMRALAEGIATVGTVALALYATIKAEKIANKVVAPLTQDNIIGRVQYNQQERIEKGIKANFDDNKGSVVGATIVDGAGWIGHKISDAFSKKPSTRSTP